MEPMEDVGGSKLLRAAAEQDDDQGLRDTMLGDGEEEEKKEFDPNDHRIDVEHVRQDDFFYKIKEHNKEKKHYIIEIPQIKKKYRV